MSDPRNVAHAKKVSQEKKHHGTEATSAEVHAVQTGKKKRTPKKQSETPEPAPVAQDSTTTGQAEHKPAATLEGSLTVLTKLKEMEFHSRATLERLGEMMLTVEDELKQKELAGPVGDVYSAQDAFQTKLTSLIEVYMAECDRLQGGSA